MQEVSPHSLVVRAAAFPPPCGAETRRREQNPPSSIWAQPTQQRAAESQHAPGEHNLKIGRERARYEPLHPPNPPKEPQNLRFIKTFGLKVTDMSILHLGVGCAIFWVQLSSFCRTRSLSVVVMTTSGSRTSSKGCWGNFRRPSPCSIPTSPTTPSCRATPSVSSSAHGARRERPISSCCVTLSICPSVCSSLP